MDNLNIKKNSTAGIISCLVILAFLTGSCKKDNNKGVTPVKPPPAADTVNDIKHVLAKSGFRLFNLAVKKAGLDTALNPSNAYTILAPTDSACTAAGFTETAIKTLSADSLKKVFSYHFIRGSYADSNLVTRAGNVAVRSLRQDVSFTPGVGYNTYQQYLFIADRGVFYVNGKAANKGERPINATNGSIYPVHLVIKAPGQTLYAIIKSKPELSFYAEALRISDSLYKANLFGTSVEDYVPVYYETNILASIPYITPTSINGVTTVVDYTIPIANVRPTIFAPTNEAFKKAGFNTLDDLRNYANRYPLPIGGYDEFGNQRYSTLDSLLKTQLLFNVYFMNDLTQSGYINNGYNNLTQRNNSGYISFFYFGTDLPKFPVTFQTNNNTVRIIFNKDRTPANVVSPNQFTLALNGVLCEVDQVFIPPSN